VERARENNARFDDVKQLLQLSENERVKLMEQVEQLQEDNMKWRPIRVKLEERIDALLSEVAVHSAEIHRLQQVDSDLKVEKDKVAAANVQVQSWQDIAADLQDKLERWEEVHETTVLQLRQTKEDVTRLTLEHKVVEARVGLLEETLEANGIPVPEEHDEANDLDADDDDEDGNYAEPLTTLRTSALLRGQLPDATVPIQDDPNRALGLDELVEEPAWGTHEKQE
jgi:chromosome segregation ATPase